MKVDILVVRPVLGVESENHLCERDTALQRADSASEKVHEALEVRGNKRRAYVDNGSLCEYRVSQ
jgi:hypothetical protein